MANVKISQLPSLSTMTDLAQIPVVAGGTTYQITGSNLSSYFSTSAAGSKIVNGSTEANIGVSGGNANISVGGISNVAVFTQSGVIVSGVLTAPVLTTNNIRSDDSSFVNIEDGVNITGAVIAAGNVVGNYFIGNGSQLTGLPATYGNANVVANLAALGPNPVSTTGNITGNYFIGNGSQLTGITGNLDITGTTIEIAAGASETVLEISPNNSPGWAYLKLPNDATSNTVDTQLNNDNGNVSIGTGGDQFGVFPTWLFDNTGNLTLPEGGSLFSQSSTPSGSPGNTIVLQPAGSGVTTGQKLMIYPTANDGDHIHLTSGNLYQTELFLGSDNFYVKLANTGDIVVQTDGGVFNTAQWTFGSGGTLTLPNNSSIKSATDIDITIDTPDSSTFNWQFGADGSLTLPIGVSIDNNVNPLYPKIIADSGKLFSVQGQGNTGSAALAWTVNPNAASQYAAVAVTRAGGDNLAKVVLQAQSDSGNVATAKTWQFSETGNLTLPGNLIIAGNTSVFGTDAALIAPTDDKPLIALSSGANGSVSSLWAEDIGNVGTSNIAAVYVNPTPGSGIVRIAVGQNGVGSGPNLWDFGTDGTLTAPGNISAVNLVINNIRSDDSSFVNIEDGVNVTGAVVASANITGGYILGNGSQLTGVNAVTVDVTDTNGLTTIYYPTFVENRTTAQIARADVNLTYRTDDNLLTVGNVSVTGNIDGGNLRTAGQVSATGNITGGNILGGSNVNATTHTGTTVSVTGNITGGNLAISGNITSSIGFTGATITINNAPGGVEGAEIQWALPSPANTSLSGTFVQDVFQNGMRFFESSGNTRGLYMDLGNAPNGSGTAVGYRDIPQISFTGNATIATTDAGRHYYSTLSTGNVLTIANNASQSFQVGAAISIVNQGTGTITVAQGSGVTLYLAGNATAGNRSVATFGMATLIKVATDTWFINGTGVA